MKSASLLIESIWLGRRRSLASFAWVFFLAGGAFTVLGVLERWLLVYWYEEMSVHSWHFWLASVPYIEYSAGVEEFVNYRFKIFLSLGVIHLIIGIIFVPLPDLWVLVFLWAILLIVLGLALRSHFIDVALEINKKFRTQSQTKGAETNRGKR